MIWYDALLVQHSPLSGAVLVQNSSLLLDMWPRVRDQVRAVINMFVYLLIPPPIALCFFFFYLNVFQIIQHKRLLTFTTEFEARTNHLLDQW